MKAKKLPDVREVWVVEGYHFDETESRGWYPTYDAGFTVKNRAEKAAKKMIGRRVVRYTPAKAKVCVWESLLEDAKWQAVRWDTGCGHSTIQMDSAAPFCLYCGGKIKLKR